MRQYWEHTVSGQSRRMVVRGRGFVARGSWIVAVIVVAAGAGVANGGLPARAASESPASLLATDAEQQMVPADMQPNSLTITPSAPLAAGATPDATIAGLTPDPALDSANVRVFDQHGSPHVAQVFAGPVNYQDATGAWVPIQSQLVSDGAGGWQNKAGPFKLDFPASWSLSTPASFGQGPYGLSVAVAGMAASSVSKTDASSVSYASVLPSVDVAFLSTNVGYRDEITLRDAAAPGTVTFQLGASGGLSLALQADGTVGILDKKGTQVGSIPAPLATDAATNPQTGLPDQGSASYALSGGAGGLYQLAVTVDPTWLAQATYPVVIDPTVTPNISLDTYVDDGFPNTSYGSAATLDVKAVSGGTAQHSLLNFPVGTYFQANRVVLAATIQAYAQSQANQNTSVTMKRITGGWGNTTTWNTAPTNDSTGSDSATAGASGWFTFDGTNIFQTNFDAQASSGVMLMTGSSSSNNQVVFASSETSIGGAVPVMTLQYDDPPSKPVLSAPADGAQLTYGSPTLSVTGNSTDAQSGDTVHTIYQVTETQGDWANLAATGTVENGDTWTVPAGVLDDGKQYWWRAGSWDGYANPLTKNWTSGRTFTIVLPKFGDDSRWAMTTQDLGNGLSLKVNQATGNLYLGYTMDSLSTPVGMLDLHLAYNSLDTTDAGMGRGWILSAGPGYDALHQPTGLTSTDWPNALHIKQRDGSKSTFTDTAPNSSGVHTWVGSGANSGTIRENKPGTGNATYVYEPNSGGRYIFDFNGHLLVAKPKTSDDGKTGFAYTINATTGRLTSISEPEATIALTWGNNGSANDLSQIKVTPNTGTATRIWKFTWDSTNSEIKTVTDPLSNVVTFNYGTGASTGDGKKYLTSVSNGGSKVWNIAYTNPTTWTNITAPLLQVLTVTDPDTHATGFNYVSQQTGHVADGTTVTDPKGNATTVSFDVQGYPIKIVAPSETVDGGAAVSPTTTMLWDQNGNQLCSRSPAANRLGTGLGCVVGNRYPDNFETVYTYEDAPPYAMTQRQLPVQKPHSTGVGPTWTYNYDQGITGLLQGNYQSVAFAGVADHRQIGTGSPLTHNWGTTPPTGLSAGNWAIRFTGQLTASTQTVYKFRVSAIGGVRVTVGSKVLLDCWNANYTMTTYNCGSNNDVFVELWPSTPQITVEYNHSSGTNGNIQVLWDGGGGGSFNDVPDSKLNPNLGLLTSETAPSGLSTSYSYLQVRNLPTQIVTDDGTNSRTETKTYDTWGRLLSDTHGDGTGAATMTTTTYDASNPCLHTILDGAGTTTTFQCNGFGDITDKLVSVPAVAGTKQSTAQNQDTATTYDALGDPLTVTRTGDPGATQTFYTNTGAVDHVIDPNGVRVNYTYTNAGLPKTEVDNASAPAAQQRTITYGYDNNGNQTSVQKTAGSTSATWSKTYDNQNRVKTETAPGIGNVTQYAYDQTADSSLNYGDAGFLTSSVTSPDGVQTTTVYTLRGKVAQTQVGTQSGSPLSPTVNVYDVADNLTSTTSPSGIVKTFGYDGWGDVTTKTDASGATSPGSPSGADVTTTLSYNAAGNLFKSVDPSTQQTTYAYDGDARLVKVTAPGPVSGTSVWNTTYDAAGQRIEEQDPDGRIRDWSYNQLGELTASYEYPQPGVTNTTSYAYDNDAQLVMTTPPSGPLECLTYDAYGNQTSRYTVPTNATCAGGTQSNKQTFIYDAIAGMTSATDTTAGAVVTITPDTANPNRPHQVSEAIGANTTSTTTYGYVPSTGQVTSSTQTIGTTNNLTTYAYDPVSGRVSGVVDPFTGHTTGYSYNDDGQIKTRDDASGLQTRYGYDTAGRLLTQDTGPQASPLVSFGVSYNKLSQITALSQKYPAIGGNTNKTGAWAYTYTPAGELATSTYTPSGSGADPNTSYTYDGAGNRASVAIGNGTPVVWSYDGASRLTSAGSTSYTWNSLDELTAVGGGTSYLYDVWGRQQSATASGQTVTYAYDALSRATSRTQSGTATNFTYDAASQSVTSQKIGGAAITYYTQGQQGPLAQHSGSTTLFYQQDPHGDLAALTDTTGTITGTISYDPFGNPTALGQDAQQSLLGYQSQPLDPTTGLTDMGARLYDPTQGRFTTQDSIYGSPTNPLSLNQYIYATDSPLAYTDPTGMSPTCDNCTAKQKHDILWESAPGVASVTYAGDVPDYVLKLAANPPPLPKAPPPPQVVASVRSTFSGGCRLLGRGGCNVSYSVPSTFDNMDTESDWWSSPFRSGARFVSGAVAKGVAGGLAGSRLVESTVVFGSGELKGVGLTQVDNISNLGRFGGAGLAGAAGQAVFDAFGPSRSTVHRVCRTAVNGAATGGGALVGGLVLSLTDIFDGPVGTIVGVAGGGYIGHRFVGNPISETLGCGSLDH
jgi:RHS repeat-associated protein